MIEEKNAAGKHSSLDDEKKKRLPKTKILLRSSWQMVNIGDIAHTPGVLHVLEEYYPEAEVALWPCNLNDKVRQMINSRFPEVEILERDSDITELTRQYDFLLHGSGPSLVAAEELDQWRKRCDKPYGVFGITLNEDCIDQKIKDILACAAFVYFRDSRSLQIAIGKGVNCPVMEFGPDGAFAVDLHDDISARKFMNENKLEDKKFACCIPRYRYTPYWLIKEKKVSINQFRHQRNEEMKEHDNGLLRETVIEIIRNTDLKVLLCPEDQTQMAIAREMINEKLPQDIKQRVVCRDKFWCTDEAISTYRCSAGLFGLEQHSPIMCIGNGIPASVGRFAEQTTKGYMWQDIGLDEWLFDFDNENDRKRYTETILKMLLNSNDSHTKADHARKKVQDVFKKMSAQLALAINSKC